MVEAYHIIIQGFTQAELGTDSDYEALIQFLINNADDNNLTILAYLVMPDHVHCLVKPPAEGKDVISAVEYMRAALHSFSPRLKDSKIIRVRGRARIMGIIRHMRLEPVKAGLVSDPEAYRWFGSQQDDLDAREGEGAPPSETPRVRYEPPRIGRETEKRLSKLMVEVCRLTRVSPEQVRAPGANHRARDARQLFVFTARHCLDYPELTIAQFLGTTTPVIVRVLTSVRYSLEDDPERADAWMKTVQGLHRLTIR